MWPTMEVRWFLAGAVPEAMRSWFGALEAPVQAGAPRVDWYLHAASHDGLGIKVREGSIEIKQRVDELGVRAAGDSVRGTVERWVKWSFKAVEAPPIDMSDGYWVPIAKTRETRVYAGGRLVEGAGCNVELAVVEIGGAPWWTLGLEAFGPSDAVEAALDLGLDIVRRSPPPVALLERDSMSYPRWLGAHGGGGS